MPTIEELKADHKKKKEAFEKKLKEYRKRKKLNKIIDMIVAAIIKIIQLYKTVK